MHGVICETTKHATSTVGICEFKNVFSPGSDDPSGSLRFESNESNKHTEIQCFQQVKPGLEVKKTFQSRFNLLLLRENFRR